MSALFLVLRSSAAAGRHGTRTDRREADHRQVESASANECAERARIRDTPSQSIRSGRAEFDLVAREASRRETAGRDADRREGGEDPRPAIAEAHHSVPKRIITSLSSAPRNQIRNPDHVQPTGRGCGAASPCRARSRATVARDPRARSRRRDRWNPQAQRGAHDRDDHDDDAG